MKIGVNAWTFPGGTSLIEGFALARRAGFDVVEINLSEEGELTLESGAAEVKEILHKAEAENLELNSLSSGLYWKYPLTSPDEAIRKKGSAIVRRQLELAAMLGVNAILVVPGVVTAEVSYDAAYDRAGEALSNLASEAQQHGVKIGVENVWNKFLLSPLEFGQFLDEINSEYVGAYFDVGNVLLYGYPEQWIRILGPRICKVHVKDFKTGIGNRDGFCNPLQGDVPWGRVRVALEEIGYDDTVTAEVDGYTTNPAVGLKHIAESLRSVFGAEIE